MFCLSLLELEPSKIPHKFLLFLLMSETRKVPNYSCINRKKKHFLWLKKIKLHLQSFGRSERWIQSLQIKQEERNSSVSHHKTTSAFHLCSRIKTTTSLLTKTALRLHNVDCLKKNEWQRPCGRSEKQGSKTILYFSKLQKQSQN